jgi:hypothetical protein
MTGKEEESRLRWVWSIKDSDNVCDAVATAVEDGIVPSRWRGRKMGLDKRTNQCGVEHRPSTTKQHCCVDGEDGDTLPEDIFLFSSVVTNFGLASGSDAIGKRGW